MSRVTAFYIFKRFGLEICMMAQLNSASHQFTGRVPLTSARGVVARDIRELTRLYPEVPNEKLHELMALNKSMHPEMRK